MPTDSLLAALEFLREADKLKSIVRRTRVTFDHDRFENDAEHSWHLALMAIVLTGEAADPNVDLCRVLCMVLVHDLVEIDAGDAFFYDGAARASQVAREHAAAERIFGMLEPTRASSLRGAWEEFEAGETREAVFARALDRAQPVLQNLHTGGGSWKAHGVTASVVRERTGPIIRRGAPKLWEHIDRMLSDAVAQGILSDGQ